MELFRQLVRRIRGFISNAVRLFSVRKSGSGVDAPATSDIILRFESFFIPYLVREYSSGKISLETLTDTAMMQTFVLLNDHDRYLPAIERTMISVETDRDNRTVILYTFPELDTATTARYGAIVLTPDNSPQYYTLERTPRGRMVLCRIEVWRHTIIRYLPERISAGEFISMSKSLSTISGQEDSDMYI